ncbi:DUF4261 domain-containing protein [Paenibacillus crassostreae]|uniref:DUF4261 domain-containing protein n=1 Tax=Paenibacillus crassostreae TaxID=1763538 RepID=A0A167FYC0_9BACL|nr:DUF4261 domain-containing protein [Paenibacillus crassostreae]AOZ93947.1 hypothetical protein LPB68_18315 [Paenibacillus crassostreae]OAB77021.1 hypothetical protein PNBC_06425 [Paenibacillus crassostreae]
MTSDVKNNSVDQQLENDSDSSGFAPIYIVEFLYDQLPVLSVEKLRATLEKYTGIVKISEAGNELPSPFVQEIADSEDENSHPLVFFHMDHKVSFEDVEVPAQSCIYEPRKIQDFTRFDVALQQSFHWQNVRQTVEKCQYSIRIHDLFTAGLPYKQRFELILGLVQAIEETAPCKAMYWHGSEKLVHPTTYLEAVDLGEKLYGAVNLRLYSTGKEKVMIMDTLGLSSLGIPDIQCHFYGMDPSEVARDLLVISKYLYDQGDIIHDGESIGTSADKAYLCEHQHALVVPERYVLDLNPGAKHAASQFNNNNE